MCRISRSSTRADGTACDVDGCFHSHTVVIQSSKVDFFWATYYLEQAMCYAVECLMNAVDHAENLKGLKQAAQKTTRK
jgi:hypothetical protein